jgi:hypothetical protein
LLHAPYREHHEEQYEEAFCEYSGRLYGNNTATTIMGPLEIDLSGELRLGRSQAKACPKKAAVSLGFSYAEGADSGEGVEEQT